jgi:hypothetical protein
VVAAWHWNLVGPMRWRLRCRQIRGQEDWVSGEVGCGGGAIEATLGELTGAVIGGDRFGDPFRWVFAHLEVVLGVFEGGMELAVPDTGDGAEQVPSSFGFSHRYCKGSRVGGCVNVLCYGERSR